MPFLNSWRVLHVNGKAFLAAREVKGHPYISSGPIITSTINDCELHQGDTIKTKSGTEYRLGTPLPTDHDCEFARPLLLERVCRTLSKQGIPIKTGQIDDLHALIDQIFKSSNQNS